MENYWDGKQASRRKKTEKTEGEKLNKLDGCLKYVIGKI